LVVACLLAFVFVVSHAQHYLNSDESPNTIIASAVPPERTAAPATTPTDPPADAGTVYGSAHAADVCSVLTDYPSVGGILGIAQGITQRDGLSPYQAGEAVGTAVYKSCPQFVPLLTAFAHMGSTLT
jgi:hypothetical protein